MMGIERMMERLLRISEEKQQKAFAETIQDTITTHVKPINDKLEKERNDRLDQGRQLQEQQKKIQSQLETMQLQIDELKEKPQQGHEGRRNVAAIG